MLLLLNAAKKKLSRGNPAENHEMHRLHDTFMCSTYPHDDVESLLTSIRRQSAHTPSPRAKKTFGLMINDIYDTSMVARALRYGQRKQKNLRRDERGVVVNERAPKKKKSVVFRPLAIYIYSGPDDPVKKIFLWSVLSLALFFKCRYYLNAAVVPFRPSSKIPNLAMICDAMRCDAMRCGGGG